MNVSNNKNEERCELILPFQVEQHIKDCNECKAKVDRLTHKKAVDVLRSMVCWYIHTNSLEEAKENKNILAFDEYIKQLSYYGNLVDTTKSRLSTYKFGGFPDDEYEKCQAIAKHTIENCTAS